MNRGRIIAQGVLVLLVAGGCVVPGADSSAGPSGLSSINSDLSFLDAAVVERAGIDIGPMPADAPAPKVDVSAAAKTADANVGGGSDHGPLLAIGRGQGKKYEDVKEPVRTVWIAVYGPGGHVPMQGPQGGWEKITLQVVLIDDQTGEFLNDLIESQP